MFVNFFKTSDFLMSAMFACVSKKENVTKVQKSSKVERLVQEGKKLVNPRVYVVTTCA